MSLAAEPLLSLAVTVTSEQRVESVLRNIVQGLASQPGVVLTRIWPLPSSDRSPEPTEYLRLVASAGTPVDSPREDWSFLQGHFSRLPLNVGKVGQVAANRNPILIKDLLPQSDWILRSEWAKREGIRSFAGHPLIELAAILEELRGGIGSRSVGGHEAASGIGESAGDSETELAAKRYGPKRVKRKAATSIRKKKKMSGAV